MNKRAKIVQFSLSIAIVLGLTIGGYFLYRKKTEVQPPFDNVAVSLIDVLGDGGGIAPGSVTARCSSAKESHISDQYDILKEKLRFNPGTTTYLNGVYVTLAPMSRRPLFQVRYPNPSYCEAFLGVYEKCYKDVPKEKDFDRATLPAGRCIKAAAETLHVKENWAGMIEQYEPKPQIRN